MCYTYKGKGEGKERGREEGREFEEKDLKESSPSEKGKCAIYSPPRREGGAFYILPLEEGEEQEGRGVRRGFPFFPLPSPTLVLPLPKGGGGEGRNPPPP